jgi:hypothetical protein
MKKIQHILLITFVFLFTISAIAKEGMWIPSLLKMLNEDDMKTYGLKITAEDIYDINNSSIKDAIVHFNGGCTSEIISADGLLLTNHHCGYGQIQAHSSVENDYLTNGFWAMNKNEELPNEDLTATFIVRIEDVTDMMNEGITEKLDAKNKRDALKKNMEKIIESSTKNSHYEAVIKPFYFGNKYYMFITETFKDIRLVGAPPSSIGKFGGDTDNWMWPRHTGDFAIFRIYANPSNNKPAAYSPNNAPYKPKHFLPINISGVEEGDFTMVYGFPGRTMQYLTSYAVDYILNKENPAKIKMRDVSLDIMDSDMIVSDKVRIQYAAKYARISNYHKKWIGENRGLRKLNAVEVKRELERKFIEAANKTPETQKKYGHLMKDFEKLHAQKEQLELAEAYYKEFIYYGPDMITYASQYRPIVNEVLSYNIKVDELKKGLDELKNTSKKYFKNLNLPTEKKLFEHLLRIYYENVSPAMRGSVFAILETKFKGDFKKYTDYIYSSTILVDEAKSTAFLEGFSAVTAKKMKSDVGYAFMEEIMKNYYNNLKPELTRINGEIEKLSALYVQGLQELLPNERKYYPDANGTLRVSYGKVEGYHPQDGVTYFYYTTMDGMMQKHDNDHPDFVLPEKLLELYENKDFGNYAKEEKMRVCFIASNHTTGGNSGSPVLDGYGNLIGLNFDRTWESTMSDIMFDPERCRNIVVDARYILFIIDKYAGATHLIDEMKIITAKDLQSNPN